MAGGLRRGWRGAVRVERTTPMVSTGAHFAQRREPLRGAPCWVSRVDTIGVCKNVVDGRSTDCFVGRGQEVKSSHAPTFRHFRLLACGKHYTLPAGG